MHIIAALFIDTFEMRTVPGPATRIDLTGIFFSIVAPSPLPVMIEPHLIGLIYCPTDEPGKGVFEVVFRKGLEPQSEQLARQVSPFTVEPGKFTYRLVRGSLQLSEYGQCFAHCRIDQGPWTYVPLTLLPPVTGEELQSPP